MKFILREDVPTLATGESAICIDSLSVITKTAYEGLREHHLKDWVSLPTTLKRDIKDFLNETYQDVKSLFKVVLYDQGTTTEVFIPKNNALPEPANPTKRGYTFAAWLLGLASYDFATPVVSDIALESSFTLNTYNITYVLAGGTNHVSNPETYTVISDTITLGAPTKDGYTFVAWTEGSTIPLGSTGNKTFTATYTPIEYDITYVLDGGANHVSNPATYNIETDEITLGAPTKDGYTFVAWTEGSTIPLGSTGNKTFTATWTL